MTTKAKSKTELSDDQLVALDEIEAGRAFAIEMFGESVSVEDQFAVSDCIYSDTADEDRMNLRRSRELAKKIFAVEAPTPEQVVGIFIRVFDAGDDGEE